ncbi:MAG: hypothetical protein ACI9UK_002455 [Candidatus Krumholzibacteriia bacterium]|jgi:hypothetical protein
MNLPELFPRIPHGLVHGLIDLEAALKKVMPLRSKHRSAIAGQVRALSEYMTMDRDSLPPDYMNQPPLLSAYLHYFLPWNLYRQGRLLAGLNLRIKPGSLIVDLGAGPLTFLLALWLSRPGMHEQELRYLGVDRSDSGLKMGRQLFRELAGAGPWQVKTESRPAGAGRRVVADVLVMANFLNEADGGTEVRSKSRDADDEEATFHEQLLARWEGQVAEDAAILLIEPGMRASARNLFKIREAALARGWKVEAPCPHADTCPLPGMRGKAWCHFNFVPESVPLWLEQLSRRAKLPKDRASLSFLLLTRGDNPPVKVSGLSGQPKGESFVRVVSESFDLPDWQRGRYGCSERGLVLLQDPKAGSSSGPRPGELLQVQWPPTPERDKKSGALILPRTT